MTLLYFPQELVLTRSSLTHMKEHRKRIQSLDLNTTKVTLARTGSTPRDWKVHLSSLDYCPGQLSSLNLRRTLEDCIVTPF